MLREKRLRESIIKVIDANLLITIAASVDEPFMNWLGTPLGDQSYNYANHDLILCKPRFYFILNMNYAVLVTLLYFGCHLFRNINLPAFIGIYCGIGGECLSAFPQN
jgi:hypothetical protein